MKVCMVRIVWNRIMICLLVAMSLTMFSVPELDMEHTMNSVLFHEDGCPGPFVENQSVSKHSS